MYLVDKETVFKFGIKKNEGKYLPVQINDDAEIKEGQVVFTARAYTAKDVIKFNSTKDDLEKMDFIIGRTSCNFPFDNVLPIILFSVNYMVMGLSVMSEEDERLFM